MKLTLCSNSTARLVVTQACDEHAFHSAAAWRASALDRERTWVRHQQLVDLNTQALEQRLLERNLRRGLYVGLVKT